MPSVLLIFQQIHTVAIGIIVLGDPDTASSFRPTAMIIARLVMVESGFDGGLSTPLEGQQAALPGDVAL
ncbi:MAG: hypothetical protein ACXWJU_02665 [Hyphomicrobium sp.]